MCWIVIFLAFIVYVIYRKKFKDNNKPTMQERKIENELDYTKNLTLNLERCVAMAEAGDAAALFELGYRYYYSIDVDGDINKAVYFTRLSANKNSLDGKFFYYILYCNLGTSYNIDRALAESYLKYLADLKEPIIYNAKYLIAEIYCRFVREHRFVTTIYHNKDSEERVYAFLNALECFLAGKSSSYQFFNEEKVVKLVKNIHSLDLFQNYTLSEKQEIKRLRKIKKLLAGSVIFY